MKNRYRPIILLVFMLCSDLAICGYTKRDTTKLTPFYVDGYHGGKVGHMPAGSWRDIVNGLERYPLWKISLDIEPVSWNYLKNSDPEIFLKVQRLLNDTTTNSRLEIVSPAYMQPYCWNISGESNIRQLVEGMAEVHKSFPGYPVRTYAVQEPCWTSSLPQILKSLGFTHAVLKDPATAFGGYTRGMNKSTVLWKGPDGTSISSVPRYLCENLNRDAWETESCSVSEDFVNKCHKNGIQYPVGNQYQDLGWPAHPAVDSTGVYVYIDPGLKQWPDQNQFDKYWWNKKSNSGQNYPQLITWREYFKNIAPEPTEYWNLSQEDIQVNLMWGSGVMNSIAKKVHKSEKQILRSEKFSALASVLSRYNLPDKKMEYAWEQLMMAQHHDAWICPVADISSDHWASFATLKTGIADQISGEITDESISAITSKFQTDKLIGADNQTVCVLNSSGFERCENVELITAFDPGVMQCEVSERSGRMLTSQLIPVSWYGDGSINAAKIIFSATIPSLGYDFFRLKPIRVPIRREIQESCEIHKTSEKEYTIETDLYKLIINTAQGGCISGLYDKSINKEFVDQTNERSFNEFRGYFQNEHKWLSSKDSAVRINILENGPLRIKTLLNGKIGRYNFETVITLAKGEKQIDFKTKFFFDKDVLIGEPWEGKRPSRGEHRKPCYDSRWKLQAFFPSSVKNQVLYKNAPYDVCRSELDHTFFNTWSDLKHNIILDWVDVYDSISNRGLAIFSDRTTSYSHGKEYPLALTMAWSGYGLWEAFYPMNTVSEFNYAVLPHSGKWNDAGLSSINASWNEPMVARLINNGSKNLSEPFSFLKALDKHIEIPTLYMKNKSLFVRLFNSNDTATQSDFILSYTTRKVELTEVDGKVINEIEIQKADKHTTLRLQFRPFEIKTLKIMLKDL